jgi:hypothetical protein
LRTRSRGKEIVAAVVLIAALGGGADAGNSRRRTGNRLAQGGVAATITGIVVGSFAIGLSNGRPDAAKPFFAASLVSFGLGAVGLTSGLYLRATSPGDPPDAIALDPVRSRRRNERRVGVGLIGASAAVLITGILHGIGAAYDNHLAAERCTEDVCDAGGARLRSRAHTMALASDMLTGMGAIGLAGGFILYRGGHF